MSDSTVKLARMKSNTSADNFCIDLQDVYQRFKMLRSRPLPRS